MALGSTQPLTEVVPREFPGCKCDRCVRLTILPPPCALVMKFGNLNFLEPSGPLQACNGTVLPLPLPFNLSSSKYDPSFQFPFLNIRKIYVDYFLTFHICDDILQNYLRKH